MSSRHRGFILPTTLMVMTLLTVMLTAAFILISAEFRTTDNSMAMSQAHALAQAGLQKYLTLNRGISPGTNSDSTRITYANGYTDVIATRLVAPNASGVATWIVRATGVMTGNTLTGQAQARRTVAQLATFNPGVLPLRAAFIAANKVHVINGAFANSQPFLGTDACGVFNHRDLSMAVAGDLTGATAGLTVEYLGSSAAVLDSTHIDWASLLAGNFTPDYTLPSLPVWSGMPIGLGVGDWNLPSGGVGILVITGDLTLPINPSWTGVLIVGGRLRGQIAVLANIEGTVITGLNNIVSPGSVGTDTVIRGFGASPFQWNSCQSLLAVRAMASMSPFRNGYIDTWATY